MIYATVIGRIGKDATVRYTQKGDSVTGFSVASDSGYGENKKTAWVNCSIWGKRGEKLSEYLTKGQQVTAIGELTEEEYNGKVSLKLNITEIVMQGGKKDGTQKPSEPKPESFDTDEFDDNMPF
jgi:single-strand DNA-binding protein